MMIREVVHGAEGISGGVPSASTRSRRFGQDGRALIDNTYFFEYAVTDPEARWLILENHHDFLIFVGDVAPGLRLAE